MEALVTSFIILLVDSPSSQPTQCELIQVGCRRCMIVYFAHYLTAFDISMNSIMLIFGVTLDEVYKQYMEAAEF